MPLVASFTRQTTLNRFKRIYRLRVVCVKAHYAELV
jgi:hypothetical protein